MTTLTIPRPMIKSDDLVVLGRKDFERLAKENKELRLAVKAIVVGELELRHGKTRTFKDFLKTEFPKYAKSF
ncbi:hypothetical protein A3G55_03035 [Candidatus Giovannonibacteria bacterium RIFCSPLOWO2_12_FULL_44_25]|uniref:Uncharacterized protein n=2 Tax=Candidatus Giovannoniibacteriota TaxID=1752738 RepID=A0A1F5W7C0_9BACT|nr:MAG: hypothetical protein UW15_C0009G0021 [Parcubacteria group bacterium GW2011_GWC1_44_10]KKT59998.1 MAG: hypothetical protein UW53_C0004G0010 [Candidatus Giovannonibacteria bacterium GW2011_GWA1_44_25]KKU30116.1 MAG: hypothetical protein UX43_C0002G0010 [Candidatus Giovannonibacteria bacterium GW2011_GWB1_46_20]OGF49699.1 MAG: hypothetical protein A2120_00095 [Candidatus Giovannonibacteria bacterium GWA2_45_15]OGF59160.1 MAG: hypothetical protein A2W40_03050 [Candidatus Giovannonibacteria 